MPTYLQQLATIEADIAAAANSNQVETLLEKCLEKSDLLYNAGIANVQGMAFLEASENFAAVNNLHVEIEKYKTALKEEGALNETYEGLFIQLKEYNLMCLAYYFFSMAQFNNQSRNPGIAAGYFDKAKSAFLDAHQFTGQTVWKILSTYCSGMQLFAEAMEDFYRANFSSAKTKCQRSYLILQDIINNHLNNVVDSGLDEAQQTDIRNSFKSDYQTIKSYYYVCDAKTQFNNRNFKNAAKQFAHVAEEMNVTIENYHHSLPEPVKSLWQGEYNNYLGWKYLSEAELAREQADWGLAFTNYEEVRNRWELSSSFYVQSKLPQGVALQEYILNQALNIDVYQTQCEKEQELNEKVAKLENQINDLQERIGNAIKPMGVTINNTQEVVTTVEQNAQFIQNIEYKAKENIKELLEALKNSAIDEPVKKQIEKDGNEVLNSAEKGPKFFDKVKKFTKDTAEVVKNVGEIATPIVAAIKALSLLL